MCMMAGAWNAMQGGDSWAGQYQEVEAINAVMETMAGSNKNRGRKSRNKKKMNNEQWRSREAVK